MRSRVSSLDGLKQELARLEPGNVMQMPTSDSASLLKDFSPENQKLLPSKLMQDSYCEIQYHSDGITRIVKR